jgi:hypothetical protein
VRRRYYQLAYGGNFDGGGHEAVRQPITVTIGDLTAVIDGEVRPNVDFFGLPGTAAVAKDFHVVRAIRALAAIDPRALRPGFRRRNRARPRASHRAARVRGRRFQDRAARGVAR